MPKTFVKLIESYKGCQDPPMIKRFLLLFAKCRESMYTELFWHMGVEQAHHSWGLFLGTKSHAWHCLAHWQPVQHSSVPTWVSQAFTAEILNWCKSSLMGSGKGKVVLSRCFFCCPISNTQVLANWAELDPCHSLQRGLCDRPVDVCMRRFKAKTNRW